MCVSLWILFDKLQSCHDSACRSLDRDMMGDHCSIVNGDTVMNSELVAQCLDVV